MSTVKFSALFKSAGLSERHNTMEINDYRDRGRQRASGTSGFWSLAWVIAMSEEKCNLVDKTFKKSPASPVRISPFLLREETHGSSHS